MSDGSRECDLVMKGGITTGIVYPPAVLQRDEHGYRTTDSSSPRASSSCPSSAGPRRHLTRR
ncbi:hypothetical protein [Sorangium sp. So ce1099]|uniref:hypothetical protein n=1 Tax=Sorangium sp. So ce1099 TaxID=3133331 RepID=UPI003F623B2B